MQTARSCARLSRISVIVLVLALSPPATFAQDDLPLPGVREFSMRDLLPMSPKVGEAFNEAVLALNAGRFDKAGDAIGKLRLDRLNSYERGKAERVLEDHRATDVHADPLDAPRHQAVGSTPHRTGGRLDRTTRTGAARI